MKKNINTANYSDVKPYILEFYPKILLKKDLPSYLINKVLKDINLMELRQKNSLSINKPKVGDFVLIDGIYFRIGLIYPSGKFQVTGSGSFHMHINGFCSHSGGFEWPENYESFHISKLILNEEIKTAHMWFFSNEDAKGHNGVYFNVDFKVWKF